jgi:hypothetical protein
MLNSELLKEAIADAKAVRDTALMNAKAVLEESFSRQVREMFADKLREDSAEENTEEDLEEVSAPNNVAASGGEANPGATKDVSKGDPKKVSDAATNFRTVKAGKGPNDVPEGPKTIEETAEENVEEAGLTSEELEEIIGELESEVSAEEGTFEAEEDPAAAAAPAPVAPEAPVDPMAQAAAPAPCPAPVAPVAPAPVPSAPVPGAPMAPALGGEEGEEDINLEELIRSLSEEVEEKEKEDEEEEKVDESTDNHGVPKNVGGQDAIKSPQTYPKTTSNKDIEAGSTPNTKGCIGDGDVYGLKKENTQLRQEVNELRKGVQYLRGELNEINVLNAKLLYTSKLVKEHNLSKEQMQKVVDTFDLTKNLREVKLTYTALKESMNFGGQLSKKPSKVSRTVQTITEGLASKTVASTKPSKEIISEGSVNEMRSRFMKIANISTPERK